MTTSVVTDEQIGTLARRQHELFRRVREGTIPLDFALAKLQELIEGKGLHPERITRLTIGLHASGKGLARKLESNGANVAGRAWAILTHPEFEKTLLRKRKVVELRYVTRKEIMAGATCTLHRFLEEAARQGHTLCSPEVGAYLRLAHTHKGPETIHIGMMPIMLNREENCSDVLAVTNEAGRENHLWAASFSHFPNSQDIPPDSLWVFER